MPNAPHTLPWHDRHRTPDEADLIEPVVAAETGAELFDQARTGLVEDAGLEGTISWHGIPWRWSFAYARPGDTDNPIAYVVPEPGRPLFCCRVPVEVADEISAGRLHRSVREGLARGSLVGADLWVEWELTPGIRLEDLITLVRTVAGHSPKR